MAHRGWGYHNSSRRGERCEAVLAGESRVRMSKNKSDIIRWPIKFGENPNDKTDEKRFRAKDSKEKASHRGKIERR